MSPRRIYTRLGRRGQFLVYAGLAWFLLGYGYITDPPQRPAGQLVVHDLVPYPWWGAAWMLSGALGVAFAWTVRPGRDRWGYTALVTMPVAQCLSYTASWAIHLLHELGYIQQAGSPRGIFTAVVFLAIAAFVRLVAGWAEPTKRLPVVNHPGGR